jgi:O-acetylhomoserine/O-acetylserine sulfhydrylase-like pyridoxal-dependent enzyme
MLDGGFKEKTSFWRCTKRVSNVTQFEPVMEVMPELRNAEETIVVIESGTLRVVKHSQNEKRLSEIVVNCDGVSNVTDVNLEQNSKAQSPRMETEQGTVKEMRLRQYENA